LRSIILSTVGIVVASLLVTGTALYFLTGVISFTQGLSPTSRLAVALLGSTILLALSPASTIAVIREVRARGDFTRTVLSITVFMDVVIIVLFAIDVAAADVLLTGSQFSPGFVGYILIDLVAAGLMGLLAGLAIRFFLGSRLPQLVKIVLILLLGFGIFAFSFWLTDYTHDILPFEIHIEPILAAMIGGFFVTNFTPYREEFDRILHDVGPLVYVAFFTLTGVSLKLDVLLATLPVALALFAARGLGIFGGSFVGSTIAGTPRRFRGLIWMGLITQAGIALGLAREVAVEFAVLGDAFATLVISVVVLNEVIGPLFLKFALRRVGETNEPDRVDRDETRDAVIVGIEEQSMALARRLQENKWHVTLVDRTGTQINGDSDNHLNIELLPEITGETLCEVMGPNTDALVTLLPDDDANFRAARYAHENCGVPRIIVRPNDLTSVRRFTELGALIVEPASAMVNLLDQAVRAPQTALLTLHEDPTYEIIQVTVTNPAVNGRPIRDLRLPTDVLVLEVVRRGQSIVPGGYTPIRRGDEVTLIGSRSSLEEATLKLGY
ncbi:MAG: potassium transporter TrkA, partial [Chloroflexi bacterium]|nr:potassium transporter TrkA [Chloroflexota bacterium]